VDQFVQTRPIMSENPRGEEPRLTGGKKDPRRTAPLDDRQFADFSTALKLRVTPLLNLAATELKRVGFPEVRVTRRGAMASLFAGAPAHEVEARLRFQIHDTFAPLVTGEPVFWMTTVYRTRELIAGRPGRLPNLDVPDVLEKIVAEFVECCKSALKGSAPAISAYFETLVSRALKGEAFIAPPSGGNIPLAEWNDGSLGSLVLPALTAARECLAERFPNVTWTVEGSPSCRLEYSTPMLKNILHFFAECPADGFPLLFFETQGDNGRTSPHSIPIVRTPEGFWIRQHQLWEIVGKFVYAAAITLLSGRAHCRNMD
jgi:hypothetical protein